MQTPCPTTPSWPAPSPVTIFLRNIHLLQLDQQPDWPGLSRKLFSGGQKAQTQRVKSVEWVLYQLFLLWDPSETKNVCPPLAPLRCCSAVAYSLLVETSSVLPTFRATAIGQPSCGFVSSIIRSQEKWRFGTRDHRAQDHAG